MNEEKQYLQNEEDSSFSAPELTPVAFSVENGEEFSGPSGYAAEQHIIMNGEIAPDEAFEFSPEMATEWELLNPEEKAEAIEIIQEAVLIANVSETGNTEAEKAARVSSLGTAFALAEVSSTDDDKESLAQVGEVENSSFWKRTINAVYETAGKGARVAAIAATLGVATIAPMKSAQAGFFDQLAGSNVEQTIRKVDRVMRGNQELQNIKQQQEYKQMRIDQLDQEKADLVRRTSGNTRVDQIQNTGENKARNIEIEADYKAQKAELKAQRAQAKADYLRNQNRGEVEEARYEAALARIDAQAARIDAQYETNRARESVRVNDAGSRIDREGNNLSDRISQIEMEQERLRLEIKQLNVQKTQRAWETTRDISR